MEINFRRRGIMQPESRMWCAECGNIQTVRIPSTICKNHGSTEGMPFPPPLSELPPVFGANPTWAEWVSYVREMDRYLEMGSDVALLESIGVNRTWFQATRTENVSLWLTSTDERTVALVQSEIRMLLRDYLYVSGTGDWTLNLAGSESPEAKAILMMLGAIESGLDNTWRLTPVGKLLRGLIVGYTLQPPDGV